MPGRPLQLRTMLAFGVVVALVGALAACRKRGQSWAALSPPHQSESEAGSSRQTRALAMPTFAYLGHNGEATSEDRPVRLRGAGQDADPHISAIGFSVSPCGRYLGILQRTGRSRVAVYITERSGGEMLFITKARKATCPSFGPDGRFAFWRLSQGADLVVGQLPEPQTRLVFHTDEGKRAGTVLWSCPGGYLASNPDPFASIETPAVLADVSGAALELPPRVRVLGWWEDRAIGWMPGPGGCSIAAFEPDGGRRTLGAIGWRPSSGCLGIHRPVLSLVRKQGPSTLWRYELGEKGLSAGERITPVPQIQYPSLQPHPSGRWLLLSTAGPKDEPVYLIDSETGRVIRTDVSTTRAVWWPEDR